MFTAKYSNQFMYKTAVEFKCIIFHVEYRKGPDGYPYENVEFNFPAGQEDGSAVIRYVYHNASDLGVDKTRICIGGVSGGGWISLGASYLLYKSGDIHMVKLQWLDTPMISNQLPLTPVDELAEWEKGMAVGDLYAVYKLLAAKDKPFEEQMNDLNLFPGNIPVNILKELPPMVLTTSEFDFLRRDSLHLKRKLEQAGKLVAWCDMPGVVHGYQADQTIQETKWFVEDCMKVMIKHWL